MLKKVLVANRGEIAVRIIGACHDLGIQAVAAYSEADRDTLAVRIADEAVCIGPAVATQSYLNPKAIISAARITGCDAIHPGYGFLAEDATFAEMCAAYNLCFVGPHADAIRLMADKLHGRNAMQHAGVPILPGAETHLQSIEQARTLANQIEYPVILKPSAGGGGRGVRVVANEQAMPKSYTIARAEALTAFGCRDLLLEKYLSQVRHIEIQVLADHHGNIIHLGERDCSIQRRHQKITEESPSPMLSDTLREQMGEVALRGARSIGYNNAGTMEFLVDNEGNFYFIEMNTRIQVEHPVTELVTGVDLVAQQLLIAGGEPLSLSQQDVNLNGHAIECRINAEDPERDFLPVAGDVTSFRPPGGPGVRVDTHLYPGYELPRSYDSLLAKIITWGNNRSQALTRMRRALDECVLTGVPTTIPFQRALLDDAEFCAGNVSTRYVAEMLDRWKTAA